MRVCVCWRRRGRGQGLFRQQRRQCQVEFHPAQGHQFLHHIGRPLLLGGAGCPLGGAFRLLLKLALKLSSRFEPVDRELRCYLGHFNHPLRVTLSHNEPCVFQGHGARDLQQARFSILVDERLPVRADYGDTLIDLDGIRVCVDSELRERCSLDDSLPSQHVYCYRWPSSPAFSWLLDLAFSNPFEIAETIVADAVLIGTPTRALELVQSAREESHAVQPQNVGLRTLAYDFPRPKAWEFLIDPRRVALRNVKSDRVSDCECVLSEDNMKQRESFPEMHDWCIYAPFPKDSGSSGVVKSSGMKCPRKRASTLGSWRRQSTRRRVRRRIIPDFLTTSSSSRLRPQASGRGARGRGIATRT